MHQYSYLAPDLCRIAREAGRRIMLVRQSGKLGIREKIVDGESSDVGSADKASHNYLQPALGALTPDIPIVSEEGNMAHNLSTIKNHKVFWAIDPLDGTSSFNEGFKSFAVNMALIDGGIPVLGVVYFPAMDILFYTGADGKAYKQEGENTPQRIQVKDSMSGLGLKVAIAYSDNKQNLHSPGFSELMGRATQTAEITNALRVCMVADGINSGFHAGAGTQALSIWDRAGPDAVLRAAGGILVNPLSKQPLTYGTDEQRPPLASEPFIGGSRELLQKIGILSKPAQLMPPSTTRA